MTDKTYKLKVTNYMVKKKGMKSCGDEWIYNPNKMEGVQFKKEFCINGYLLYSIIKGL